MSRNDFDELKKLIEQGHAEHKEDILALQKEIARMRKSLLSCQSHCHVKKEEPKT
jgi:hypothetical protein